MLKDFQSKSNNSIKSLLKDILYFEEKINILLTAFLDKASFYVQLTHFLMRFLDLNKIGGNMKAFNCNILP